MDLSTSYTIKAQVQGQNQIGGLEKSLGGLKTSTDKAATSMGKLKNMAGQAFGALKAIAPAIGIAGMGKLVNDTLTLGDELGKLAEQTHIPAETLDKLRQAANLAGVDFKKVSKSFGIFAENMMDFTKDKGIAYDALERLNISPEFINTRGYKQLKEIDDLFFEVAEAMNGVISAQERVDIAKSIFGGQGMKMIPLLNMGKEGIMGLDSAFSDDFADRIEAFNDNMAQLGEKFNFLKFSLTESLLPALELAVGAFTKVAEFLKNLPKPIQSAIIAFGLLAPAIIALAPVVAALIFSFKTIAAIKMGVVIAKITTAFGGVLVAVKAAIVGFAPLLAAGAIPAAIIGLGVLIFKFRDEIGAALQAVGQFFVDAFSPLTNFIGNIFNGAMDLARNAFNRLPNIVQEAIKFATAPLRGFIKFVKKILSLLGKVKGSKIEAPKPTVSTSTSTSSSSSSSSLPKSDGTGGYAFPGQDMSIENVGAKYGIDYSSQLPSGGYSITQSSRPQKQPNINIQTGNVVQMDGTDYVTTKDLERAVSSATRQTFNYIEAGGVRHYL